MRFVLLLTLLSSSILTVAQGDWNLKIDKPGLKVYNHKTDTSRFSEIKVDGVYQGRLSDLVEILYDVPHHKDWSYGTYMGYVLKKISDSEILFYKEISTPPPLSNRDFVGSLAITQDPITKVMTVKVKAVDGYLPVKEGLVRVIHTVENWIVTPLSNDSIKIEYYLKVDPGGSVSPVLVNMFATKGPYETFKGLKEALMLRKGKPVKYSFIKD
jgi:hypothetical protein